jgi:NAD-dependent DNA ligase
MDNIVGSTQTKSNDTKKKRIKKVVEKKLETIKNKIIKKKSRKNNKDEFIIACIDNKPVITVMSHTNTSNSLSLVDVQENLNEKMSKILGELSQLMMKKGEPMKARAYQKAEETILGMTSEIKTLDDIKGQPGIGPTILSKIDEYLKTGTLAIIEREKEKPEYIFTNIYGVGPQKAKELVEKGIRTISELRDKKEDVLNNVQQIGLKYYEDILERIPRKEIDDYKTKFDSLFQHNNTFDGKYEIVGSYRRGLTTSGDIDVIITSENPENFDKFLDRLISENIIIEVLSRGKSKCLVIAKIASSDTFRRVDFLYTSPKEYPFAILYFTGSKAFNAVMRGHALKMGFSLNEHGMSKEGIKGQLIDHIFENEESIFDFLQLQYIKPTDRIDGRNIISKTISQKNELIVENEKKKEPKRKTQKVLKKKSEKIEMKENNISEKITQFKEKGISILDSLSKDELIQMIDASKDAYYNQQKPILNDNEYDILEEYTNNKFKNNIDVGAPVTGKNKVNLPFEMASMDKIKPDSGALSVWTSKYTGPYVLSCKLDGVSGLYFCDNDGKHHLYTRGDGHVGQDISQLIKPLKLPKMSNGTAVRGEFILPKMVFQEKYKDTFANARNLVSGIINRKTNDEKSGDLDFVTYEVVHPLMPPSEQLLFLKEMGHKVVQNMVIHSLTNEYLSSLLVEWRTGYIYEIDGVIVSNNAVYNRISGNPDHSFAFKMVLSDQVAEAKVLDVIWTPSKDGYLKPRVRIEPIQLAGVKIEYATGFNGKFIEENKIGLGAIITMVRSGDVIPYIQSVTVPSENAKMPDIPYEWTDTHVDIKLKDPSKDTTVIEKNITNFFVHLEVDGLSTGNIKRIMNAGFSSVPSILKMEKVDFEKVEGFKSKMIEKVYKSIQEKVGKASLLDIMVASGKLGRGLGERKIKPILTLYPDILLSNETKDDKIEMLKKVNGIGKENSVEFVENIPVFLAFLKECDLENKLTMQLEDIKIVTPENTSDPFYMKKIVMSKTRDKNIIDFIKMHGGIVEDSINKETFLLIIKSIEDVSSKVVYAKKHNIPILSVEQFNEKYLSV